MLTLHQLSYIHPNGDLLFEHLHLTVNAQDKVALVGNNGAGKSSLLYIVAGERIPSGGTVAVHTRPYHVPQHFGQFNDQTVAQALGVAHKQHALTTIMAGTATEADIATLDDDWLLEERCAEALSHWQLPGVDLNRKMATLSGGQKTKVFLAGIAIHQPALVLFDEPTNHLDTPARQQLCDYIAGTTATLVVVSHDRTLLNLLNTVAELGKNGMTVYGGNYDFYLAQKDLEAQALNHDVRSKEKALRKAKAVERESMERKQKLDARGKRKQEKAGLPTILMNTLKNNAEKSTSKLKEAHAEKVGTLARELSDLRKSLPGTEKMKLDLNHATQHAGKKLIEAQAVNYSYGSRLLWKTPLSFTIACGERVAIRGGNGVGKTTLIRMLLGTLQPHTGVIARNAIKPIYVDQDYGLIDNRLTVYDQAQQFNDRKMPEHDVKIRLNRFLFTPEHWDKPCSVLSGGEKMRLMLCGLTIRQQAPDVIVLDEPTNNLDIQNIQILTGAIQDYRGTLIVISHDRYFLDEVKVEREISLDINGN